MTYKYCFLLEGFIEVMLSFPSRDSSRGNPRSVWLDDDDAYTSSSSSGASFLELWSSRRDRWKLAVVGLGACAPMMKGMSNVGVALGFGSQLFCVSMVSPWFVC